MSNRKITRALISVFYKDNLEPIVHFLGKQGVEFVSTGGTQDFIEKLGYPVTPVEKLTGYPSIFGGRVKTLHPAVFGGILYRRDDAGDVAQANEYKIGPLDLVIVDLYPFEETVAKGGSEEDIIDPKTGESIVKKNRKSTKAVIKRIQDAGIKRLEVPVEAVVGRVAADRRHEEPPDAVALLVQEALEGDHCHVNVSERRGVRSGVGGEGRARGVETADSRNSSGVPRFRRRSGRAA